MFKKLLLVAVIGVAAFAALRGTKFFGLAKQEIAEAQSWVESQIPVEKEISRLRKEVGSLDKDRVKVQNLLANEIVEVRYLRENTDELRTALATEEERLHASAEEIKAAEGVKGATTKVKYGRATVPVTEAKAMLKADVARYGIKKSTLDNMEKNLSFREKNKDVLDKQLDVLKRQKEDLSIQLDRLEAEYKTLQLEQMESKYQSDNTRLASIKESLRGLQKKLEVERVKLNLSPRVNDEGTGSGIGGSNTQSVDEIMAPVTGTKGESAKK